MSSNAFHPALAGVLYDALAEYESRFVQLQLAANLTQARVDDEVAVRYAAIVDGLKKMIKLAEPLSLGNVSGLEGAARMQRAIALAARISSELWDFDIWSWDVGRHRGIKACVPCRSEGKDARAVMREIADRLGLEYSEERHGKVGATFNISASGEIDGTEVELYELMPAERPFCDTHNVMVDAAGVCPECPSTDGAEDLLAELRRVHVPELHNDVQVCSFCSERQEVPILWPCSDIRIAKVELSTPPSVFCTTDPTTIEPPGDAS